MIPPRKLYLPILPIRLPNGALTVLYLLSSVLHCYADPRLLFCLCHCCAATMNKDNIVDGIDSYKCPHTDDERVKTIKNLFRILTLI